MGYGPEPRTEPLFDTDLDDPSRLWFVLGLIAAVVVGCTYAVKAWISG